MIASTAAIVSAALRELAVGVDLEPGAAPWAPPQARQNLAV
jgi:hypothetical protein